MDDLLRLAFIALRWRVFAAIGAAVGLAVLGVRMVPWLGGLQGIALVVAGFIGGLAWEARARGEPVFAASPSRDTESAVAAMAFAVGGSVWGLISSTSPGSAALGALLAIVGLAGWVWSTVVHTRKLRPTPVFLNSASLLAGYAASITYVMFNG